MGCRGRNGKGRKSDHDAKAAHEKALAALQPKPVDDKTLKISHHLAQHPIRAQPASPLLTLPGEVRNMIYGYVLKADGDLQFVHRSARSPYARFGQQSTGYKSFLKVRGDKSGKEFNLIKFVCRGLYNETMSLEFKYNTIYFDSTFIEGRGVVGAAQLFNAFVQECGPKAKWLSRVDLSHHNTEKFFSGGLSNSSTTFEGIEDFCLENPKCMVRFYAFDFKVPATDPSMFFDQGFDIHWVLRHKAFPDYHGKLALPLRLWTMDQRKSPMTAKNFRIFPREGTSIDEKFLNAIARIPMITNQWYHLCIDLAEDWVMNGI